MCFHNNNYRLHVLHKRITYTLHFVPCHLVTLHLPRAWFATIPCLFTSLFVIKI